MSITASMVKELRERTGAGMMECKKALGEVNGDMEAAIEYLRKKGMASAEKKASRAATEGKIEMLVSDDKTKGVVLEINCETDFVAKDENFANYVSAVAQTVLETGETDIAALAEKTLADGRTVEVARNELISKIGENISNRRATIVNADAGEMLASYSHGSRIGVMVRLKGSDEIGRDVAMHVAATNPHCISADEMPAELIEKEKEIFTAQAKESGKPDEIIEKMITGRINKFLKENTLLGQPFVKNPDVTVEQFLKQGDAAVSQIIRFEVGEGMEKKQDNFAEEVMAQAKGA